jgi:peroxiredoxin
MAAAVGQPAPEFSAKLASGTTVNMNLQPVGSLTRDGHQSVLLWFYPRASTPG